jgi:hypothetical protein
MEGPGGRKEKERKKDRHKFGNHPSQQPAVVDEAGVHASRHAWDHCLRLPPWYAAWVPLFGDSGNP